MSEEIENTEEQLVPGLSNIIPITIEDEMKAAYIDYSMSVIVSRALPDVRDGLKPVHRRVLYGMTELGLAFNRPYKKSARIVGEVMGKYHPHGDSSVYDTMVRMAQSWSMRYPLVDGQGNFGSIDGDNPAAMRYTEARLTRMAEELLNDIDKDTVDFRSNFDDSLKEPTVLPSKVPNLLINGASGIAVGMATNMPPHHLGEVVEGIKAYIDNEEITGEELRKYVKGPDFPTGGIIYGYDGVKQALETGRGRIVVRGRANIETYNNGNRERIIITEIPYQVNKSSLVAKAADLVNEKVIEGISEIRDESDRNGMRVVFEIKRDADANVVLNKLYRYTALQSSFNVNNIALVNGRPIALNLKDLIVHFVAHRHEVIVRRTKFELAEAEARAHILEGLLIALDHLDEVIALIRASQTPEEARNGLIQRFELSEIQAKAILDMRLQRLTGLERDKLKAEYEELQLLIAKLKEILENIDLRKQIIKDELDDISKRYNEPRRTEIVFAADEFSIEDMFENEEVVITISRLGYIKRTSATEYRTQGRGGRGSKGAGSRDEDFIEHLFSATMHSYMLFFTQMGKCYWMRVFEIPEGGRNTKGRAIQNLVQIDKEDSIKAYIAVNNLSDADYLNNNFIFFGTKNGTIKKTSLEAYSRPRQKGIIAINIEEGDELLGAVLINDSSNVLLATKYGQAIRFEQSRVRSVGRNSTGVRGIRLNDDHEDDAVVGMIAVNKAEESILILSENGYGKRTELEEYRITNRGGKGIRTIAITEKTGQLTCLLTVTEDRDLMIITKSGILIRLSIEAIRLQGRNTQGVRLIKLGKSDAIASIATVDKEEEIPDAIEGELPEGEVPEIIEGQLDDSADEVEDGAPEEEEDNDEE